LVDVKPLLHVPNAGGDGHAWQKRERALGLYEYNVPMLSITDRSRVTAFIIRSRVHDSGRSDRAKDNFLVRRTAAITAAFLLLFFFVSLARTELLEMASQSVTKSEGTISRETIVTTEGIKAPPKPKGEAKPLAKPIAKPEAKPVAKPEGQWSVQVSASRIETESLKMAKRLKDKGYDTRVVETRSQGHTWYRVRVGHLATKREAQALLNILKSKEGLGGAFLVGPP
jgi:cell division septation protein DedD